MSSSRLCLQMVKPSTYFSDEHTKKYGLSEAEAYLTLFAEVVDKDDLYLMVATQEELDAFPAFAMSRASSRIYSSQLLRRSSMSLTRNSHQLQRSRRMHPRASAVVPGRATHVGGGMTLSWW